MKKGAANNNWRGGRSLASNGYMLVRVGRGHRLADVRGYAYEHRLVAEKKLGRKLRRGEIVHHVDENPLNNVPSNLEVMTRAEHRLEHRIRQSDRRLPGERNPMVLCACGCGEAFALFDLWGRRRGFSTGHNTAVRCG